ncbi:MAG: sulfatase [Planctomycetaceae bacterium]|nr:sulfatase [Planctomycetaceae bacterium]
MCRFRLRRFFIVKWLSRCNAWHLAVLLTTLPLSVSGSERPNILFLLTDNQPWHALGAAPNPVIYTPNMDRLAHQGVRFTNAFVTTPICAASRASIFTGLYERQHGFTFLTPPLQSQFSKISYPMLLKASGYRTGFIGKFGIESNGKILIEEEENTLAAMFDHFDNFEHWGHSGPDGYFVNQPDGTQKHLTDITGDKALEFLRQHHDQHPDQPFCLSISFNAPHAQDNDPRQYIWPPGVDHLYHDATVPVPELANPKYFATLPGFLQTSEGRVRWSKRFTSPQNFQRMMKGMYRMVSGVDVAIGRMLDELQRLDVADDTVVIFMSDNGMFFGEWGLSDCWLLYEDSIRVPMIIADPRQPQQGITADEIVLNIDVSPTIIELAGLDVPPLVQGRSLIPIVEGKSPTWRTEFLCEHLLHMPQLQIPKSEGVRTERWKYIRYFEQQPPHEQLFDLVSDPLEKQNLADDTKHTDQLQLLRQRCDELLVKVRETTGK